MLSIALHALYAKRYTLVKQGGARLGDLFREHLREVERNDKDAPKPVARHFNLPNHSSQHMTICGLSLSLRSKRFRRGFRRFEAPFAF